MTDNEKLELIREAMPVTQRKAYLNTGTSGPLARVTHEAIHAGSDLDFTEGRASFQGFMKTREKIEETRQRIASLTKADPTQIALTHNTTTGMNIAVQGFNWQPGDEVVTTTLEHEGGLFPLYVLRHRYGVVLKIVDIGLEDSPETILAKLEAEISPRTRLLVFSHVAWNTGIRLPLAEIVAMGHRHHVLSVVDAAQSTGAIPLDLPASGVDFYAMPGQKWLCGPEGTGAFYVRQDRISLLNPTFVGYLSMRGPGDWDYTGYFHPAEGAKRYEVGSRFRPSFWAMTANLAWLEDEIGWPWIYDRIQAMAGYARQGLGQIEGVEILTPSGPQAGLISFTLAGYDPARVVLKLAEDDIVIRSLGHPYCLRVSTGFYNTEADIDKLTAGLRHIQTLDPDSLPELNY